MTFPPVHPRDPLHGIKLETIIHYLVARYGWTEMGDRIPIRCFQMNPSVKSSLTFLRKTPWARQKVEAWYVEERVNNAAVTEMTMPKVGAQLIVFGKTYSIETDTDLILDAVKAAGYEAVEGGAKDAALYRRKLDERGLVYAGTHTGLKALLDLAPMVRYLQTVGGNDWCISGLMTWEGRTLADYLTGIDLLNKAGRELRKEGIHLHYHNHDFEFLPVDGARTGMDLLLAGLDPAAVDLCVDVAWVRVAGGDPAEFLRSRKDRVGYLHFKDHDGKTWIELGQGRVDWPTVMKVLPELPAVRWVMVEQDSTAIDPSESIAISRRFLKDRFNY